MKCAALAACLFITCSVASADSLRASAGKVGMQASVALGRGNMKAFDAAFRACVTSDFKFIEGKNHMNYAAMLAHLKQGVAMFPHVTGASAKLLSCVEHGKIGQTTTSHTIMATMIGADKKPHKVIMIGMSRDNWVNVDGTWKMSTMTLVSQKATMDGKPFSLSAPSKPSAAKS